MSPALTLVRAMKRLICALVGATLFGGLSYGLVELFASWYAPRYIHSDSDINDVYMASLCFMLVCVIAGGAFGFSWGRTRGRRKGG